METFGFTGALMGNATWILLSMVEMFLAAGVAIGSRVAAALAGALMFLLAATLVSAMLNGRNGAPCGCFGPKSKVGPTAVVRDLLLGAAFVAVAVIG